MPVPARGARRGPGRGRGSSNRGRGSGDGSAGQAGPAPDDNETCGFRFSALLLSLCKLLPQARYAYTFDIEATTTAEEADNGPLLKSVWHKSGIVCSQYYSRRFWANGVLDGEFYELITPLEFTTTLDIMKAAHAQLALEPHAVCLKVAWQRHRF